MSITFYIFLTIFISGGVGGAAMYFGRITTYKKSYHNSEKKEKNPDNVLIDREEPEAIASSNKKYKNRNSLFNFNFPTLLSDIFVGAVAAFVGLSVAVKAFDFDMSVVYQHPPVGCVLLENYDESMPTSEAEKHCNQKEINDYNFSVAKYHHAQYEMWLFLIALSLISGFAGIRLIENISNQMFKQAFKELNQKVDKNIQESEKERLQHEKSIKIYQRDSLKYKSELQQMETRSQRLNAELKATQGSIHYLNRSFDEAVKYYSEAIKIDPKREYYGHLALAQSNSPNAPSGWTGAIESLNKGLENINNDDLEVESYDHYTMLYNRACFRNLLTKDDEVEFEKAFPDILRDLEKCLMIDPELFEEDFKLDVLCIPKEDVDGIDKSINEEIKGDLANLKEKLSSIDTFSKFYT